jgi:formylglycine-generating enzyme required for sulfatase activity
MKCRGGYCPFWSATSVPSSGPRPNACERLERPKLTHQQRERIGYRLAEIGDPREGVGLDDNGLPHFVWCRVPPGRIELEEGAGAFEVASCHIARYPVTWKQYRTFLAADDGYRNAAWWRDLMHDQAPGDQYRQVENHPSDEVSWDDAMAYCRWLTVRLRYEIRLPAEWEWQQAATGGAPSKGYPWGEEFDSDRANTYESRLGRTTAVGLYSRGESSVGAMDMSGNVLEWCLNTYEKPERIRAGGDPARVVRGGSWDNLRGLARAAYRYNSRPENRLNLLGFRVLCLSPIPRTAEH